MHKYITRTMFAVAMLALAVNNGLDIWQKLKPDKVQAVDPVAVPISLAKSCRQRFGRV